MLVLIELPVLSQTHSTPQHRIKSYQLESAELRGTSRMTLEQVAEELGLAPGVYLNDELVMTTRSKLLGLGLFKSVILAMRKGKKPGWAKLIIDVEDDTSVLSSWALGGSLGVTIADTKAAPSVPSNNIPMNFRLGLVGRNLFSRLHRGSGVIDFDDSGLVREAQFAYGLPRFAHESAQFDAEIAVVDPRYRFWDSRGFGARGQGLWSQSLSDIAQGEWNYGVAMYLNERERFKVPGFPRIVAGPKIGFYRETRLRGFFPQEGSMFATSLVVSPIEFHKSVMEMAVAHTLELTPWLLMTLDTGLTTIGIQGYSGRGEIRFDLPFVSSDPNADQAAAYLSMQGGQDMIDETNLVGSSAVLGMRYHSSGFIADIGIKITRAPEELAPKGPLSVSGGPNP
jgi:hypothetical protein